MSGFDIRTIPKLPLYSISDNYYLYDTFDTALAAGAVNGTLAEPVGGARTVTDTNSKISIAGGVLSFATGEVAFDSVTYPALSRVLGRTLLSNFVHTGGGIDFGWDENNASVVTNGFAYLSPSLYIREHGLVVSGALSAATTYTVASILRETGSFLFIKGGAFTNWTLLYPSSASSAASVMPRVVATNTALVATIDNIRVPKQTYIPVPLQSDGMSQTVTDGLGNPENNGVVGTAYGDFGTWGVSGGVRSCSVLGGATGSSVLATSSKNVHIEVKVVRSAGFAGISARRADSSNYIRCTHDGTNVVVTQVIAGTPTVLSTTAVTYSAGATLKFDLLGTAYRAYYNNTAGGTGTVTDTESTNHGVITSATANTFDNLVIWAKGNENQYNGLNNL